MKLNAAWHKANPMPKNPTLDQRVTWHAAHAKACACREMPAGIRDEIARRRIEKADDRRLVRRREAMLRKGNP